MNKKIILLNGPPGSGKDTAGDYLSNKYPYIKTDKFARVLKEKTHALYGFPNHPHNYYELVKEIPNEDFYGLTPRQAYINVSETYFKPIHGNDIFGRILVREIEKYDWKIMVITDSGFKDEAQVLVNTYGEDNIILVKLERKEFSFKGDSRNYIELGANICTTTIFNTNLQEYLLKMEILVKQILSY